MMMMKKNADDGDDDYMVGLETWWGKRAARAGRASMTNPQATLPYTDQVHLVDLYKGIGLRVLLYTDVMANWPLLYTQTSTSLSTQQTRVLLFFLTNIMVDSSLDGHRHPCLIIICYNMKHTVVPSINMCTGVCSIVHVNYCHTDLLTMFFTA